VTKVHTLENKPSLGEEADPPPPKWEKKYEKANKNKEKNYKEKESKRKFKEEIKVKRE
jgi:hypothetical protein